MTMFLSSDELSQLSGYKANQRSRICRWLDDHNIKYTTNRLGDPVVLRSSVETTESSQPTPNLEWLKRSA